MSLKGKVAIVTGGSRGIGRAIAQRLGETGATMVVNYAGNETAASDTVSAVAAAGGLARELGPRGITVNVVSPGPTDTELCGNGKSEQDKLRFAQMAALGPWACQPTSPTRWRSWSARKLTGSPDRASGSTAVRFEGASEPTRGPLRDARDRP